MNSYHRSDSLLFQFILHEYIRTLETVMAIRSLVIEKVALEAFCHQMTEHFVKLAGSEQEYMRIFSWIVDAGLLTKLKNYADLLVKQKNGPLFLKLLEESHQAWSQCLSVLDQLRKKAAAHKVEAKSLGARSRAGAICEESIAPALLTTNKAHQVDDRSPSDLPQFYGQLRKKGQTLKGLKAAVVKALQAIELLTPTIEALLPAFRHDENVLFFLLRHKEELDRVHEAGWTKKWFNTLQPKGADTFMIERYQARGFGEMIPEIKERYDACR